MKTGRCQCNAVQFEFDAKPKDVSFCHCSICRRLSGSAFTAYCEVPTSALRVTAGADSLCRYDVTERLANRFCGTCGTPVYTEHASFPGRSYLNLGALDDDAGLVPQYHQFAASKARWHTIADDLPRFDEWPDS